MNVLVAGGAGYIGSHTCKLLSKKGYKPITLDNLSTGNEWSVKWGPLYKGNIRDVDLVQSIVKKENISAVIHFAASAYVGESVKDPLKYFDNNVAATTQFLAALIKTNVRKIIFSSTCATYGVPKSLPITEDTEQKPINPYGFTKYCIEKLLMDLHASEGLNSIALRYFNAAGADTDLEIGESHDPETHLIPLAIQAAINDEPLIIFGNDYDTPDGTCVRDYVHVEDLAWGHIKALESLETATGHKAYNLGSEKGISVLGLVAIIEKATNKKIKIQYHGRRTGDATELVANAQMARDVLRWEAQLSIEEIINTALKWAEKKTKEKL